MHLKIERYRRNGLSSWHHMSGTMCRADRLYIIRSSTVSTRTLLLLALWLLLLIKRLKTGNRHSRRVQCHALNSHYSNNIDYDHVHSNAGGERDLKKNSDVKKSGARNNSSRRVEMGHAITLPWKNEVIESWQRWKGLPNASAGKPKGQEGTYRQTSKGKVRDIQRCSGAGRWSRG